MLFRRCYPERVAHKDKSHNPMGLQPDERFRYGQTAPPPWKVAFGIE